jgi:hypothetical protein
MKKLIALVLVVGLCGVTVSPVFAQNQQPTQQSTQQPLTEEQQKEKAEREKNAYLLLDRVIDEAQSLRLAENRARVQITAADLLWDNNQGRARSLFAQAAESVAELGRNTPSTNNRRGGPGPQNGDRRAFQLRQELVLSAARHDAPLAYQLLAATKPPAPATPNTNDPRNPRLQINAEDSLEQTLLSRVAALDPKLAAQNAEQMLDKGQFPRTISDVLIELQKQDSDAATKLGDKTVKKIQAANLLTNNEAANLAQSLLLRRARAPEGTPQSTTTTSSAPPLLDQASYVDLLGTVIDLALKATPNLQNATTQNTPQRGPVQRARPQIVASGSGTLQYTTPPQPTDAQLEQMGARRMLSTLQMLLPMVEQYLPAKLTQVRQKLTDVGIASSAQNMARPFNLPQANATTDELLQFAAVAPAQMQSRFYQQAANKALEEGNTDRARQIATDHLQADARDNVMQRIDFREMTQKPDARLDQIRQMVAKASTDEERLSLLLQLARDSEKSNPKVALQLLDDAKAMTSRRAANYDQFEQQLRVAHAFASLDPARSFEVMDPAINQLNELLSAASVLNGFELNLFRDGEMTMQGGSSLTAMVSRVGQELAVLARSDFERSETLAGRFQFAEPRIMTRLTIVQGLLGVRSTLAGPAVFRY